MAAEIERSIRKWLTRVDEEFAATPPDTEKCRSAHSTLRRHVEQLLNEHFRPITLSERAWSDALLAQAKEDLLAVEIVAGSEKSPASVVAMLLQMVFEKLAKAALARTDKPCFIANRTNHVAASRLVSAIKNQNDYLNLRHAWKDVLPMIQALERAHPAVAKSGPHLEYPWEQGDVMGLPATHLAIVTQLADPRDPKGAKLIRFARELADRFDSIFP
ncbi:hypothetical protein [Polyangium sorediatum]|uniref:Uncharacterized protein n=1 Tax=Polyangium sorediatum TaxID=889274 RepID=A0ABT6NKK8_9BACT|nr:hypothetical protein [Polyangium sorediatum]MDI1428803.1 hypothetical protein [Polyangium sorediatum]